MPLNETIVTGAVPVDFYLGNYTYADIVSGMEDIKFKLATDLNRLCYKNAAGATFKILTDASGASNTPANRAFFADSVGAAASDTRFKFDPATGFLGIGTQSVIDRRLHIEHEDATTDAVYYAARFSKFTTGSPTTGFGVGLEFEIETTGCGGPSTQVGTIDYTQSAFRFSDRIYSPLGIDISTATLGMDSAAISAYDGIMSIYADDSMYVSGGISDYTTSGYTGPVVIAADGQLALRGKSDFRVDIGAAPLTHGVSAGYIPYASSTTAWGNSPLFTDGSKVRLGGSDFIANEHIQFSVLTDLASPITDHIGRGIYAKTHFAGDNAAGTAAVSISADAYPGGSTPINHMWALQARVFNNNTDVLDYCAALYGKVTNNSTGTINNPKGFYFEGFFNTGGGSIVDPHQLYLNGSEPSYIGGRLGIKNPAPDMDLDVRGSIGLTDASCAHGMTDIYPTTVGGYLTSGANGGLQVGGLSDGDTYGASILGVIGVADPTDTTPAIKLNTGKKNGTTWQALASAETALSIQNYGTELISVLGDGFTKFNGKVHVGGSSSDYIFQTTATNAATNALVTCAGFRVIYTGVAAPAAGFGGQFAFDAQTTDGNVYNQATVSALWTNATTATMASKIVFKTRTGGGALTDSMTVTGDQYLGVGVSPLVPLHVRNSSASLRDMMYINNSIAVAAGRGSTLRFTGTTGESSMATISCAWEGAASSNGAYIDIGTRTSDVGVQNKMRISAAGLVGINTGTATPARRLEVLDAAAAQIRASYSASVYGEWQVDSSGNLTQTLTGTTAWMTDNKYAAWGGSIAAPKCKIGYHSVNARTELTLSEHLYGAMAAGKNVIWNFPDDEGLGSYFRVQFAGSASKMIIGEASTNFAVFAKNGTLTFNGTADIGTLTAFTPTLSTDGGDTVPVFTSSQAYYKASGKTVYFWIYLTGDGDTDGSGTGIVRIALPAIAANATLAGLTVDAGGGHVIYYPSGSSVYTLVRAELFSDSTITLRRADGSYMRCSDFGNGGRTIKISGFYQAA